MFLSGRVGGLSQTTNTKAFDRTSDKGLVGADRFWPDDSYVSSRAVGTDPRLSAIGYLLFHSSLRRE